MLTHKFSAIIINRRSVGDSDRFLTLYTKEAGKIDVYAKSVRSAKSKRQASLDLFSHVECIVIEKNDRRTLTHVDLISSNQKDKTSLGDIARLFQIGELVDKLTVENDPNLEVYDLLNTALTHLYRFDSPNYLLRFKKKLLLLLGFWDRLMPDDQVDNYIDTLLSRPMRTRQIM